MTSAKYLPLAFAAAFLIASPALAAPVLVEKHQIALPQMDASILKTISSYEQTYTYQDFDRNYFTKKAKNLQVTARILNDIECRGNNYRVWGVDVDTTALSRRIGFLASATKAGTSVVEARRGTKSVWKILKGYYSADIICSGSDILVMTYATAGASFGVKASFDTLTQDAIWNNPKYPNLPARTAKVFIDGIGQYPGYLSVYSSQQPTQKVYGDSRVLVPEGPYEGLHTVPRYRDLTAPNSNDSGTLTATFYRLSDGYGVLESIRQPTDCTTSPCTYPPDIKTYYRIHDGESSYSIVPELPKATPVNTPYVEPSLKGISLNGYNYGPDASIYSYYSVLIHGLPESVLKDYNFYNLRSLNRGSILWENAQQFVVRYMVTVVKGKSQYWQAVIQK